jgi:A/G-specific adenine glycosylase
MSLYASISSTVPDRAIPAALLSWYDRHARDLPWRARPGRKADPYVVWLSEIMLQQTTVTAVRPYFEDFLARWPRLEDLAAAPLDQVLAVWAGLGYYARARNLHRCARFDRPATVVDGNVERVVARLHAVETPLPAAKRELAVLAGRLTPARRPGDYAQAMMDLGATVCLPRAPKCMLCPLAGHCAAHAAGRAEVLPRRAPKPARPTRHAVAFWIVNPEGAVLLRRRPDRAQAPLALAWTELPGVVRHTFTHFHFEAVLWAGQAEDSARVPGGSWVALDALGTQALPSVMRKLVRHALAHAS